MEQLLAGQHAARPLDEHAQHREFAVGEVDEHALGIEQLVAVEVHPPAEEGEAAPRLGLGTVPAAQQRANMGEDLARRARLGEIMVRAELEPDDAILLVTQRGEQDHRRPARLHQPTTGGKAVLARHHYVEDDEIDAAARQYALHLGHARGRRHSIAIAAQPLSEEQADTDIVVDHQQMGDGLGRPVERGCSHAHALAMPCRCVRRISGVRRSDIRPTQSGVSWLRQHFPGGRRCAR